MGGPNTRPTNPRWRTAILKKPLNHHISATIWPILMKFGTVKQFGTLQGVRPLKFRIFQKPRWRQSLSWKTTKIAISQQRTDRSSRNLARLCKMGVFTIQIVKKNWITKIQDGGRPPFWKKPLNCYLYLSKRLTDFDEIWHSDANWPPAGDRPLKFRIFQKPRWRRPPPWKTKKNRDVTATTDWPIYAKFGTIMQNGSLNRPDH